MNDPTNLSDHYGWIDELNTDERNALAHMTMVSLRGNWNNPRERIYILKQCVENGVTDYDADAILSRIDRFKERYFDGWHDGRIFRTVYQDGPEIHEQASREFVERYASKLPHDMSWDAHRIDAKFGDDK